MNIKTGYVKHSSRQSTLSVAGGPV